LEIHCANTYGEDKLPWEGRIKWVADNRRMIERIAANPKKRFDDWRHADYPFCFVAACRELVAAWNDRDFISCLPVAFDATSNGLQHFAILVRDRDAAEKTNVIGSKRSDIYSHVADALGNILQDADADKGWRDIYAEFDISERRKLVKDPVMTFGYGAEVGGMNLQVSKAFNAIMKKRGKKYVKQEKGFFGFITKKIEQAIRQELPLAAECRERITALAKVYTDATQILSWTSPAGFPVQGLYWLEKEVRIEGEAGSQMRVPNSLGDKLDEAVAIRAAAANFTHSLDAAHLIRTALRALEQDIGLLTIHDSYSCLAADAADMNRIIRLELRKLYMEDDWLRRLFVGHEDLLREYGDLNPEEIAGEYLTS
jgi:DNA-directed RNA polymerase